MRIENDQVFSTQLQALEPCLRKRALRFARGDRDEAEDLFQAISVRLWENLASYRGDGPFSAWALRVADRVCLNVQRTRSQSGIRIPISDSVRDERDLEENAGLLSQGELMDSVADAVLTLPPRLRSMVVMRYWMGWSAPRIAKSLHLATPSVWTALSQARRILRRKVSWRVGRAVGV